MDENFKLQKLYEMQLKILKSYNYNFINVVFNYLQGTAIIVKKITFKY